MKILKHTFNIPTFEVKDDELVLTGEKNITYTFTLLHGGIGRFEENYGKPLMSVLTKINALDDAEKTGAILEKKFVSCLAAAAYVKIEGNKFENNRATYDEFMQKEVIDYLTDDISFVMSLLTMATECMTNNQKSEGGSSKK